MNKAFISFFTLLLLNLFVTAQNLSTDTEKENLWNLDKQVVKLFSKKQYKKAIPLAEKSVELTDRLFGDKSLELAKSLKNLGYVLFYSGDLKKSKNKFDDSYDIYKKLKNLTKKDGQEVASILEKIAFIKSKKGDLTTRSTYKKALNWRVKYNGAESTEAITAILSLADLDYWNKDYDNSAAGYKKVIEIALKDPNIPKADINTVYYRCKCAYKKSGNMDKLETVKNMLYPDSSSQSNQAIGRINIVKESDTVVNGTAINLVKPNYPIEARRRRATGTVEVEILINEQGNVVSACAKNKQDKFLVYASEVAAYLSKFNPTTLNGIPQKVSGVIVYNFRP